MSYNLKIKSKIFGIICNPVLIKYSKQGINFLNIIFKHLKRMCYVIVDGVFIQTQERVYFVYTCMLLCFRHTLWFLAIANSVISVRL